jgi:hypothetical protein
MLSFFSQPSISSAVTQVGRFPIKTVFDIEPFLAKKSHWRLVAIIPGEE